MEVTIYNNVSIPEINHDKATICTGDQNSSTPLLRFKFVGKKAHFRRE